MKYIYISIFLLLSSTSVYSACVEQSVSCVQGPAARIINGISIYRDCWRYDSQYTCETGVVTEPYCNELLSQGFVNTSTTCVNTHPSGLCQNYVLDMQLTETESARNTQLCGNDMACQDGDCAAEYQSWDQSQTQTDRFTHANASLAMAQQMATDMADDINSGGAIDLFSGKNMSCKKVQLGFKNCCDDSGWGDNIGLTDCTAEEEELGLSKEAGQTIYIGTYESGTLIKRKHQVYCSYPSKLARIFMEQGNLQLGRAYGTPKAPICTGFTQAEFLALDMGNIDLGEFSDDVMTLLSTSNIPGADSLASDLETKIQGMMQ
ncbi:MAG: conjugal transfer protein TraN [Methylococcales bacterium]